MFAHAVVYVAPLVVRGVQDLHPLDQGVVGSGEVRRAADHLRDSRDKHLQGGARVHAGGVGRPLLDHARDVGVQRLDGVSGDVALDGVDELGPEVGFLQALAPLGAGPGRPPARLQPGLGGLGRDLERRRGHVQFLAGLDHLFWAGLGLGDGQAVDSVAAFQGGEAAADLGFAADEGGTVLAARPVERAADGGVIVSVDGLHRPSSGLEAGELVAALRQADGAVDGDVVVVP